MELFERVKRSCIDIYRLNNAGPVVAEQLTTPCVNGKTTTASCGVIGELPTTLAW